MYIQETRKAQLHLDAQGLAIQVPIVERVPKVSYKFINVVAMGLLEFDGEGIDLAKIEACIPVKHPQYFPCVMFKVEEVSVLVFKNGKIILTAIKDPTVLHDVKRKIEQIFEDAGIVFRKFTIAIQNIVVIANLQRRINLEMTCLTMENCMYEPEQFPAAVIKRYNGHRGSFLLFANSKIIYLGDNSLVDLDAKINSLVEELYNAGLVMD